VRALLEDTMGDRLADLPFGQIWQMRDR